MRSSTFVTCLIILCGIMISSCTKKPSARESSLHLHPTYEIDNPKLHIDTILTLNLDDDPKSEKAISYWIGNEKYDDDLYLLILDDQTHDRRRLHQSVKWNHYGENRIDMISFADGQDLLLAKYQTGSGTGFVTYTYSFLRFPEGQLLEVLKIDQITDLNGTLKHQTQIQNINSSGDSLFVYLSFSYWLCHSFKLEDDPVDHEGIWNWFRNETCAQLTPENQMIIIQDTVRICFIKDLRKQELNFSEPASGITPDHFDVLQEFASDEAYANRFYRTFYKEIHNRSTLKDERLEQTLDWMDARFRD